MKRLLTNSITSSDGFPMKSGTLDFLQDAYKEAIGDVIISCMGIVGISYDSTKGYILWGCGSTPIGGNINYLEGAIFFNGEVYHFPAQVLLSPTGTQIVNIDVDDYTTNADPVAFYPSGTTHNVHNIRTAKVADGSSGSGDICDFIDLIQLPVLDDLINNWYTNNVVPNYTETAWGSPETIYINRSQYRVYSATHIGSNTLNISGAAALVGTRCVLYAVFSSGSSLTINAPSGWTKSIAYIPDGLVLTDLSDGLLQIEVEYIGGTFITIKIYQPA